MLLDEWKRTDNGYSTRVDHILNGGGLNGSVKLNASNVFSSGGREGLTHRRGETVVDSDDCVNTVKL